MENLLFVNEALPSPPATERATERICSSFSFYTEKKKWIPEIKLLLIVDPTSVCDENGMRTFAQFAQNFNIF
jgi:hypothetical protein